MNQILFGEMMFAEVCDRERVTHIFRREFRTKLSCSLINLRPFEYHNAQFQDSVTSADIPDINNVLPGDMIKSNNIDGFSLVKGLLSE